MKSVPPPPNLSGCAKPSGATESLIGENRAKRDDSSVKDPMMREAHQDQRPLLESGLVNHSCEFFLRFITFKILRW